MAQDTLLLAGFALLFLGFLLVLAGSLIGSNGSDVEGGGVVFVGPIPIIFGSSERAATIAAVLAIFLFLFYLVFSRVLP